MKGNAVNLLSKSNVIILTPKSFTQFSNSEARPNSKCLKNIASKHTYTFKG